MDEKLTEAQINSACLSFRHDYGLMAEEGQRKLRRDCRDWHEALSKELRPERGEVMTREALAANLAEMVEHWKQNTGMDTTDLVDGVMRNIEAHNFSSPRTDAGAAMAETRLEYMARRWEEIAADMSKERDEWRAKFENEYRKHQETYDDLRRARALSDPVVSVPSVQEALKAVQRYVTSFTSCVGTAPGKSAEAVRSVIQTHLLKYGHQFDEAMKTLRGLLATTKQAPDVGAVRVAVEKVRFRLDEILCYWQQFEKDPDLYHELANLSSALTALEPTPTANPQQHDPDDWPESGMEDK